MKFLLCMNKGASLEVGNVYLAWPTRDPISARNGFLAVLDEDGEMYQHHERHFVELAIPPRSAKLLRKALLARATPAGRREAAAAERRKTRPSRAPALTKNAPRRKTR